MLNLVGLPPVFHSGKLLDQSTQNMAKQNSGGKNPTPYTNLGGAKKTKNPNQKKKTKAKQKKSKHKDLRRHGPHRWRADRSSSPNPLEARGSRRACCAATASR